MKCERKVAEFSGIHPIWLDYSIELLQLSLPKALSGNRSGHSHQREKGVF